MTEQRMRLESVLEKLRQIAITNPTQLAIYIAETNALLQIADMNFSQSDITWFNNQVEQIIQIFLGGKLFNENDYYSNVLN